MWNWKHCFRLGLTSVLAITGGTIAELKNSAKAQHILPDRTLGAERSIVTPDVSGLIQSINGGATRGTNLFHSFEKFSVLTGETAYFNNLPEIQNIFARVTGKSISNIDGIIRVTGTANLFLLNPNGIIFGENASLDLHGSFVASTASSIKFADNTEFSTNTSLPQPLLSVSIPIGLGFGSNPGSIINKSFAQDSNGNYVGLQVQPGNTLALIGGDVVIDGGNLTASGGRIELGSVGDFTLVKLIPVNAGWTFDYKGVSLFRDIKLTQTAVVDASGDLGGDIQVQGRQVTLTEGSEIISYTLNGSSGLQGGKLVVNASDSVEVNGTSTDGSVLSNLASGTFGDGAGGDLTINTRQFIVRDGAFVSTSTGGVGNAGALNVNASKSVELRGFSAINNDLLSGLYARTQGNGRGGDVTITTGQLIAQDGARIDASTLESALGDAGSLNINAIDSVNLSGTSANGKWPSAFYTQSLGNGYGGNLTITTGQLTVQNRAEISSATFSQQGGNITINANDIRLRHDSPISSRVMNKTGEGGNITIKSNTFIALEGSDVLATAIGGRGGNITITSPVFLADIFANGGTGVVSGNIKDVNQLLHDNKVNISAYSQASVSGNVNIPSFGFLQNYLISQSNKFNSSSQNIANSCVAVRNRQRGRFVITGKDTLPITPYTDFDGWYAVPLAQSNGRTSQQKPSTLAPVAIPSKPWKIGDPIVEAQSILRTTDGRILLSSTPQHTQPESADSLVCHKDSDTPKS